MATIRRYKRKKSEDELRRERLERIGAGLATGLTLVGSGLIPTPASSTKVGQVAGRIAGVGVAHAEDEPPAPDTRRITVSGGGTQSVVSGSGQTVTFTFNALASGYTDTGPIYTWGSSTLPDGLRLEPNGGSAKVTGIPTASVGSHPFSVWAVDSQNLSSTGQMITGDGYGTLIVEAPPVALQSITVSAAPSFSGSVQKNTPVSIRFTAQTNPDSFNENLAWGHNQLPAGLTFAQMDNKVAVISGTPTETGTYSIDVWANYGTVTNGATVAMTVTEPATPPPVLSQAISLQEQYTAGINDLHVGIGVSGNTQGYQLMTNGVPGWMTANLDVNGIHFNSGVIPEGTAGNFTITAFLANSQTGLVSNSISFLVTVVAPQVAPPILTNVLLLQPSYTAGVSDVHVGIGISGNTQGYQLSISGKPAWLNVVQDSNGIHFDSGVIPADGAGDYLIVTQLRNPATNQVSNTINFQLHVVAPDQQGTTTNTVTSVALPSEVEEDSQYPVIFITNRILANGEKIQFTFTGPLGSGTFTQASNSQTYTAPKAINRTSGDLYTLDSAWVIDAQGVKGPIIQLNREMRVKPKLTAPAATTYTVRLSDSTVPLGGTYSFIVTKTVDGVVSPAAGQQLSIKFTPPPGAFITNVPNPYEVTTDSSGRVTYTVPNRQDYIGIWSIQVTVVGSNQAPQALFVSVYDPNATTTPPPVEPPPVQASAVSIVKDNAGHPLAGVAVYDHDRVTAPGASTGYGSPSWPLIAANTPLSGSFPYNMPTLSPGDWTIRIHGSGFSPGMGIYMDALGNFPLEAIGPSEAILRIPRSAFDNVGASSPAPNPEPGTPPVTVFTMVAYLTRGEMSSDFMFFSVDQNGGGPTGEFAVAIPPGSTTQIPGLVVQNLPGQGTMRVGTTNAQGEIVYDLAYTNYLASLFPGQNFSVQNNSRTIVLPPGTTAIPGGLNLRYEYQSYPKQTKAPAIAVVNGQSVLDASMTMNIGTPPPVQTAVTVTDLSFEPDSIISGTAFTAHISGTFPADTHFGLEYTYNGTAFTTSPDWQVGPTQTHTLSLTGTYVVKSIFTEQSGQRITVWTGSKTLQVTGAGNPPLPPPVNVIVDTVTVSPGDFTLKAGESHQMDALVYLVGGATNKLVSWTSSDPSVATVSATGVVTALQAGSVRIRATSTQNTAKFGEAKLIVESNTLAQAPVITKLAPTFGIVGTTSSVEIFGQNLTGAAVVIAGSGVSVQNTQVFDGGTRLRFDVKIDASAPLGTRSLLVKTTNGVASTTFEVRAANTNNNGGGTTTTTTIGTVTGVQASLGSLNMIVGQSSTFTAMTRYSSGYFSGRVRAAAIDMSIAAVQVNKDTGVITVQALKAGATSILVASDEDPSKAVSVMLTVTTATGTGTTGGGSATTIPNWYDEAYRQWLARQNQNTGQAQAQPASGRTYTVVRGDSLWRIAQRYYGDGRLWGRIYEANRDKIRNPRLIYPGQTFIIP